MSAYLPLARKYRPRTFQDLVGQEHVAATLTRAIEQRRAAQAYLFTGQRGVGKTSAARILATGLNCAQGPTPSPCLACPSCTQIVQGNSLDVIEIDGASNRGIDEIRSLRETVPFAPTIGAFRIYIIDEVHMLTLEAFNALLKTLEEPPAHVKFIFATTVAIKVPPTVLSRCQRFDFRRIETGTIVATLRRIAEAEGLRAEEAALFAIARAADGSLRDAEVILEQVTSFVDGPVGEADVTELLGGVEAETLAGWMQAILDQAPAQALALLMSQRERGRDAPQLLLGLIRHARNLLLARTLDEPAERESLLPRLVDEPPDRLAALTAQAAALTPQELLLVLQLLTGAYELIRRSPMAFTLLELLVLKLCARERWESLEQISKRLEELAAGAPPRSPAPVQGRAAHLAPGPVGTPVRPSADAAAPAPTAAQATAGQPAAPGAPVLAGVPEELAAAWPAFLERLGAQRMSLAAYLADSRPLSREGRMLTVGLPAFALHQEVLSATENKRLIERLLAELLRAPVAVQYTTMPEPAEPAAPEAPAPGPAAPPIVQDIVNLFNATLERPRPV